ncbi:hypothetical protein EJB05_52426, partial [Eragrostis curvula]
MKPTSPVRDWATLPQNVLSTIFLKLGPSEIMLGAELVCTAWRRVALEEPALWRRIGEQLWRCVGVDAEIAMERVALARAAGQCEAFRGCLDYNDLFYLDQRAPCLKSLDIKRFSNYEGTEELIVALEKLPLLENLQIRFTYSVKVDVGMLQSICQACPNLKKLVLIFTDLYWDKDEFYKEPIDGEIPLMHELRVLELYECDLSCRGLKGILDSCPLLESLHITGYFNRRQINENLRVKCAAVHNLTLPATVKPLYLPDDD